MVKLQRLSLHDFSNAEMASKEQNALRGGAYICGCCSTCGCRYYGDKEGPNDSYYGGSSTSDNKDSNSTNVMKSTSEDYK